MERVDVMPLQYNRTNSGTYVLRDEKGKLLITTKQPAILFDQNTGTLHKHGDYKRLLNIMLDMKKKFARVQATDQAKNLVLFTSKTFSVEELNRCLATEGYCKTLYERMTIN